MIGANLPCSCLQCVTGNQEQTKVGTGGKKLQEALVDQLAYKAIGFLGSSTPCSSPCSRLFATPRLQVFLLTEILPSASSNTSMISPCPSRASLLLFGKPKGWRQLQESPYTSSSHTPSDVVPTLTSPRWLCTALIYNTPLDKPWPFTIMKTLSLNNWKPSALWISKMYSTTVLGIAFSLTTWLHRFTATKKAPSCSFSHRITILIDALRLPPDNLPPSLYEFYLVMIYLEQILPNTLQEFTRTDHRGKTYTPLLENYPP